MVSDSPSIFRPFLQEFFVKASDPLFTCTLKLDVLTALATKDNCATILEELQTYVLHRDKSFVCAAVRAVGRVADVRPEVAEQCLQVMCWFLYKFQCWKSIGLVPCLFIFLYNCGEGAILLKQCRIGLNSPGSLGQTYL